MIMLTFTTEGGSREDGNVYYSPTILVRNPHGLVDKALVYTLAAQALGGTVDHTPARSFTIRRTFNGLTIPEQTIDMPEDYRIEYVRDFDSNDEPINLVTDTLVAAGYVVEVPENCFVIGNES